MQRRVVAAMLILTWAASGLACEPSENPIPHLRTPGGIEPEAISEIELDWSVEEADESRRRREDLLYSRGHRPEHERQSSLVRPAPNQLATAVFRGLSWLAEHQLPDGGWSFDHTLAPGCAGQCPHCGQAVSARTAATSLALLAFLGAGQWSRDCQYADAVRKGLGYLTDQVDLESGGFRNDDGRAITCAWMVTVLSSAICLTGDKGLIPPTQHALHRLRLLQDRATGGWPITPGGPPSTTATAWAIMALKSAEMTQRLDASPSTVAAASEFLEGEPGNETAAGMLGRFLLARRLDPPLLQRGVEFLRSFNPSTADSAGDYFASQVARYGPRDSLASWNSQLRPLLIGSQVSSGHACGSWQPSGAAASIAGGRLYETAMHLLSLEVYFRHLPVWRDNLRQ